MTPKVARYLASHQPATPCLVLDVDRVEENFRALTHALPLARIYYAVKANPARPILDRLVGLGSRFDAASFEEVRACLDAGCWLGIGGVATYKKSGSLREAIAYAPLDRLLLETDCPYLAPQRWRGKRNEPSYLTAVADIVSEVKGILPEDVATETTRNARFVFRV